MEAIMNFIFERAIDYFIDWIRLYQKDGEEIMLKEEIMAR